MDLLNRVSTKIKSLVQKPKQSSDDTAAKTSAEAYLKKLSESESLEKEYRETCKKIAADYCKKKRFNILHSNTELLLSTLTTNDPKPVIRTRFGKQQSQNIKERELSRVVGEVIERAIIFNNDNIDFKGTTDKMVQDYLLFGRGIPWLEYDVTFKSETIEQIDENGQPQQVEIEVVDKQTINFTIIEREDFRYGYAKRWDKVPWVARRHLLSAAEVEKAYGKEVAEGIKYKNCSYSNDEGKNKAFKRAEIWEFWDKENKKVVFVSEGYSYVLKESEDPYELDDFFPCPAPFYSVNGDDLVPTPEYTFYQQSAEDLELACERRSFLVKNIKAAAVAPNEFSDTLDALENAADNDIVFVGSSAQKIKASGGLAGIIMEYPNSGKMSVLSGLSGTKAELLNEIYEVTGIGDLLRGVSDPNETAKAQSIKGKFGSLRIQARQQRLQQTIRKIFKISTDILCEHFTEENLKSISCIVLPTEEEKASINTIKGSGQPLPPGAADILNLPTWAEVVSTLRENKLRNYTISVESTATAFDEDEDNKAKRIEFVSMISQMFEKLLPQFSAFPDLIPLYKSLISFTADGFNNSRSLKENIENALNSFEQTLKQPKPMPQGPDPVIVEAQARTAEAQAAQRMAQAREAEAQAKILKINEELSLQKITAVQKANLENEKLNLEKIALQAELDKVRAELILKTQSLQNKAPVIYDGGQAR